MIPDEPNGRAVDPLLTRKDVAKRLTCSESAVRSLHRSGRLKGGFMVGHWLRWAPKDVQEFIDTRGGQT